MQDTEAVHFVAGRWGGVWDGSFWFLAESARMASPAMGSPVRGVDQDRIANRCHSTNGNSWRLIPQAWAHCSTTILRPPQQGIPARLWLTPVVHFLAAWFAHFSVRYSAAGQNLDENDPDKAVLGEARLLSLGLSCIHHESCPSWSFLCFSKHMGAEVGPIIDFVTERREGL